MRIGDAWLADELLKAVFMDPPGSLGCDTDLADAPEPIEQCPHMVGLRCCRGIPQPGEWRRRECRIGYEQRVEFSKLHRGKVRRQSICSPLACPSPPCNGGALDDRRCRENDLCGLQRHDDAGDNRRAPIRAPGGLRRRLNHEGQVGVAGRSQAERRRELERMVGHRLRPSRVIREGGGRNRGDTIKRAG